MYVLRSLLRTRARGAERTRVWAHGDFGYGNAMVDPRTGALRGIIDWDQARVDLAGVDLLNFLVQREMGARACSFLAAFTDVARRVATGGFRAVHPSVDYEERLGLSPAERRDLVGWAALRMAERAIRYPRLFDRSRAETGEVLRAACEAISA
jgi:aminoglycoside phosphotransferase (APT) family kinase protein